MKCEWKDVCPHEDTDKCLTCQKEEPQPEEMTLTYTFVLRDGICQFDALHRDLDSIVEALGFGLIKSSMESPDEVTEHEFDGTFKIPVDPLPEYNFEVGV